MSTRDPQGVLNDTAIIESTKAKVLPGLYSGRFMIGVDELIIGELHRQKWTRTMSRA